MRDIVTIYDVDELLEHVGMSRPEHNVSPYTVDCEYYRNEIDGTGNYCDSSCPFIGVVSCANGARIGSDCCPMFRIRKIITGVAVGDMHLLIDLSPKVGEL